MPSLDLTQEHAEALRTSLESVISELSSEIADTDRQEYRDKLKTKRVLLQEILAQLAPSGA